MTVDEVIRAAVREEVRQVVREEIRAALAEASPGAADELLKVSEAASWLKVNEDTIRAWVRSGKLRRYGTPRTWRVRRKDLLECLSPAAPSAREQREERASAILARGKGRSR